MLQILTATGNQYELGIGVTILVLAPSLVFMMTSFLRLLIVFSFLRQVLGTQQMPPSQVMVSLAMIYVFHYGTGYERVV